MYFSNLDFITISIFLILFLFIFVLYIKIILKNGNIITIWFTFLFISFIFCLFTILWPKWNIKKEYIIWTNVSFVLDVSQSMDAELIWTNKTKLELSKEIINNYINKNQNNNYSLTIFAWNALNVIPFVSDIWIFESFLFGVSKNNLNKSWTDIFNALKIGLLNYKDKKWWVIILITDWWEEKLNNLKSLNKLFKKKSIELIVIWIWNKNWNYIPVWFDQTGNVLYKYYNSKKVVVYLSENILKNLAKDFNWIYIWVTDKNSLIKLVDNISKTISKVSLERTYDKREDLTIYFIFVAFIFFVLYFTILFISKFWLFLWKKD